MLRDEEQIVVPGIPMNWRDSLNTDILQLTMDVRTWGIHRDQ